MGDSEYRGAWDAAMHVVLMSWTQVSHWRTTPPPTKPNPFVASPSPQSSKSQVLNISCMSTFLFSWNTKSWISYGRLVCVFVFLIMCVFFRKTKQGKTQFNRQTVKYFLIWTHPMTIKTGQTVLISTHRAHGDAVQLRNSTGFWAEQADRPSAWDQEA